MGISPWTANRDHTLYIIKDNNCSNHSHRQYKPRSVKVRSLYTNIADNDQIKYVN